MKPGRDGVLRWIQLLLFGGAMAMLGHTVFVIFSTRVYQTRESASLDRMVASPGAPRVPGLIGRLEVPRLSLSAIVVEGVTGRTLRHAVGHIAGTALPGGQGNVALAGHRDTFFFPLRDIRAGDLIFFTTPGGKFRYRVESTSIVEPGDLTVLKSGATRSLTLVTCYPFDFIGPAPSRFIVRALEVTSAQPLKKALVAPVSRFSSEQGVARRR